MARLWNLSVQCSGPFTSFAEPWRPLQSCRTQEMQKSAAAARNKNRSALTFDYAPSARSAKAAPKVAPKAAPKKAKAAEEKKGHWAAWTWKNLEE